MDKIVIMDYSTGTVYIKDVPSKFDNSQGDEIMEYFCNELDIREKDCYYMISGNLIIEM